jgi:uncharacterized RmlC-like cupin family protein
MPLTAVRGGAIYVGRQHGSFDAGISARTTAGAARRIALVRLTIPPGKRARAHLHDGHESAVAVIVGEVIVLSGPELAQVDRLLAGDFCHIPAGCPHLPLNASTLHPVECVVARTDPEEPESTVLLDALDRDLDASTLARLISQAA